MIPSYYTYYAIHDYASGVKPEARMHMIKFHTPQQGNVIDELFEVYQNGNDPIVWKHTNIQGINTSRINDDSLDRFVKWLDDKHDIKAFKIEYLIAKYPYTQQKVLLNAQK